MRKRTGIFRLIMGNQKGSTLIMVLVCMLFVGIIGAMMLSLTVMNLDMRAIEKQSVNNFYSTEKDVDDFRASLETIAMDSYKDCYQEMLQKYIARGSGNRRDFYQSVADGLVKDDPVTGQSPLSTLLNTVDSSITTTDQAKAHMDLSDIGKGIVRLTDLKFRVTDPSSGYLTDVTTDLQLLIDYYDPSASNAKTGSGLGYSKYVAVAANDLFINDGTTASGNLFSGRNFEGKRNINVTAERIVVGGTWKVNVGDNVNYSVTGSDPDQYTGVMANNIQLTGGSMIIGSDCYVSDDITLYKGSTLRFPYGGYSLYGFNYNDAGQYFPSSSSAIMVNGNSVTLDLSMLNYLSLAGTAYINDSVNLSEAEGTDILTEGVQTGESISYKNIQASYMIPGTTVDPDNRESGIYKHNPMTYEEATKYKETYGDFPTINIDNEFFLRRFVDLTQPYFRRFDQKNRLVNYYLRFINSKSAADYFYEYATTTVKGEVSLSQMKNIGSGKISLPDQSRIKSIGNVLSYESGTYNVYPATASNENDFSAKRTELLKVFNALRLKLDHEEVALASGTSLQPINDTQNVFTGIINESKLQTECPNIGDTDSDLETGKTPIVVGGETYHYYVVRGPITLDGSEDGVSDGKLINTLVICDDSVVLDCTEFSGLIIAGKDITTTKTNVVMNSSPVGMTEVILDNYVKDYFVTHATRPANNGYAYSDVSKVTISFENWKKN